MQVKLVEKDFENFIISRVGRVADNLLPSRKQWSIKKPVYSDVPVNDTTIYYDVKSGLFVNEVINSIKRLNPVEYRELSKDHSDIDAFIIKSIIKALYENKIKLYTQGIFIGNVQLKIFPSFPLNSLSNGLYNLSGFVFVSQLKYTDTNETIDLVAVCNGIPIEIYELKYGHDNVKSAIKQIYNRCMPVNNLFLSFVNGFYAIDQFTILVAVDIYNKYHSGNTNKITDIKFEPVRPMNKIQISEECKAKGINGNVMYWMDELMRPERFVFRNSIGLFDRDGSFSRLRYPQDEGLWKAMCNLYGRVHHDLLFNIATGVGKSVFLIILAYIASNIKTNGYDGKRYLTFIFNTKSNLTEQMNKTCAFFDEHGYSLGAKIAHYSHNGKVEKFVQDIIDGKEIFLVNHQIISYVNEYLNRHPDKNIAVQQAFDRYNAINIYDEAHQGYDASNYDIWHKIIGTRENYQDIFMTGTPNEDLIEKVKINNPLVDFNDILFSYTQDKAAEDGFTHEKCLIDNVFTYSIKSLLEVSANDRNTIVEREDLKRDLSEIAIKQILSKITDISDKISERHVRKPELKNMVVCYNRILTFIQAIILKHKGLKPCVNFSGTLQESDINIVIEWIGNEDYKNLCLQMIDDLKEITSQSASSWDAKTINKCLIGPGFTKYNATYLIEKNHADTIVVKSMCREGYSEDTMARIFNVDVIKNKEQYYQLASRTNRLHMHKMHEDIEIHDFMNERHDVISYLNSYYNGIPSPLLIQDKDDDKVLEILSRMHDDILNNDHNLLIKSAYDKILGYEIESINIQEYRELDLIDYKKDNEIKQDINTTLNELVSVFSEINKNEIPELISKIKKYNSFYQSMSINLDKVLLQYKIMARICSALKLVFNSVSGYDSIGYRDVYNIKASFLIETHETKFVDVKNHHTQNGHSNRDYSEYTTSVGDIVDKKNKEFDIDNFENIQLINDIHSGIDNHRDSYRGYRYYSIEQMMKNPSIRSNLCKHMNEASYAREQTNIYSIPLFKSDRPGNKADIIFQIAYNKIKNI